MQEIHKAVKNGNIDLVNRLLSENVDVDAVCKCKRRPIHYACMNGHIDIVELLLLKNCDIEVEDYGKLRPIHHACIDGNINIVKLLLSRNCDIEVEDEDKWRPIHYACACLNNRVNIVELLLLKNCDIEVENAGKLRPIHQACLRGHINIVELLLSRNCDIEVENANKWRPIHYACLNGRVDILELLLSRNCNIESKTKDNEDPMLLAYRRDHSDVMELLLAKNCSIEQCTQFKHKYRISSPKCTKLLDHLEKSLLLIKQSSLREQKEYLIKGKLQFQSESRNIQSRICKDISNIIQVKIDTGRCILPKLLILICLNDSRSPWNEIMDSINGNGKYFTKQMNAQRILKKHKLEKKICGICYCEEIDRILGCGHCYCMSCIDASDTCPWCKAIAISKRSICQLYDTAI